MDGALVCESTTVEMVDDDDGVGVGVGVSTGVSKPKLGIGDAPAVVLVGILLTGIDSVVEADADTTGVTGVDASGIADSEPAAAVVVAVGDGTGDADDETGAEPAALLVGVDEIDVRAGEGEADACAGVDVTEGVPPAAPDAVVTPEGGGFGVRDADSVCCGDTASLIGKRSRCTARAAMSCQSQAICTFKTAPQAGGPLLGN